MKSIFLSKEIAKLQKANKAEMLRLFELITYLTASSEITLQDAQRYTRIIFNILEEQQKPLI